MNDAYNKNAHKPFTSKLPGYRMPVSFTDHEKKALVNLAAKFSVQANRSFSFNSVIKLALRKLAEAEGIPIPQD